MRVSARARPRPPIEREMSPLTPEPVSPTSSRFRYKRRAANRISTDRLGLSWPIICWNQAGQCQWNTGATVGLNCVSRLWRTPSNSTPAATAAGMLTSLATTAMEKVSMTSRVSRKGSRPSGAKSTPVRPARAAPMAHEKAATRLALMAASSASSRRSTTALISVPRWV